MIKINDTLKEVFAFGCVVVLIVGLPLAVFWYEKIYLPRARYPKGSRIINLTAQAPEKGCLWTLDTISGFNYWWKKFKPAKEILVKEGEQVVFRVKSSDVLHSFSIPQFHIGPYEIEAGKVKEIEFIADKVGNFKYLCWFWCSNCHENLTGRVVVTAAEN